MYLDKRDENGQLLSFLAFPVSLEIAEEGAKILFLFNSLFIASYTRRFLNLSFLQKTIIEE